VVDAALTDSTVYCVATGVAAALDSTPSSPCRCGDQAAVVRRCRCRRGHVVSQPPSQSPSLLLRSPLLTLPPTTLHLQSSSLPSPSPRLLPPTLRPCGPSVPSVPPLPVPSLLPQVPLLQLIALVSTVLLRSTTICSPVAAVRSTPPPSAIMLVATAAAGVWRRPPDSMRARTPARRTTGANNSPCKCCLHGRREAAELPCVLRRQCHAAHSPVELDQQCWHTAKAQGWPARRRAVECRTMDGRQCW